MIQKSAIMAAGMGTRLKPITNKIPKPLVTIRKKPLISYTLDILENINMEKTAVNIHHHADKLKEFIGKEQKKRKIQIIISDETKQILDTGGGVAKMQNIFDGEKILVCNCDTLPLNAKQAAENIKQMMQIFDQTKMDVLFLVCDKNNIVCHDGKADFFALDNSQNNHKIKMLEMKKNQKQEHNLVNAGIYIIKDNYLNEVKINTPFSITQYWYQSAQKKRLFGYHYQGKFIDAGNIKGLQKANDIIL